MKIVLISSGVLPVYPIGYGGLEAVLGDLAVCLDRMGHEIFVIAPDESTIDEGTGITVMRCGPCNPNARQWEAEAFQKYASLLLSESFKNAVIHDHTWLKPIYLLKKDHHQLHVMSTLHGMLPYQTAPPVDKPCMTGISRHHAKTIADGLHIDTRYVYNGINLDAYPCVPRNPLLDGRYLFLARMTRFKGAHVFFDLMRTLGLKGDLVGDDQMVEDKEYVAKLMQACDAYSDVRYWGGVERNRAARFFQEAKCYVLPLQPPWQEPFGLTMVEAMASGCPVIATMSGASTELIVEGITGFVTNSNEGLLEILKDGRISTIKSEDCRKRAEHFSRENMATQYTKLYEECLNGGW